MRAKSSIHAASAMPPKTRMAPGSMGRTVPATPIAISAIAAIQSARSPGPACAKAAPRAIAMRIRGRGAPAATRPADAPDHPRSRSGAIAASTAAI